MLLVGEPYGYDGTYAGTGHAAVYLSGVCTISPVVLRLCAKGETGIVLSRYSGIRGYDWIAIPLTPYLYAVKESEDIPLLADDKLVAFLRDRNDAITFYHWFPIFQMAGHRMETGTNCSELRTCAQSTPSRLKPVWIRTLSSS